MTVTVEIQNADKTLFDALKGVIKLSPNARVSIKKTEDKDAYSKQDILKMEEDVQLYNEGKAKLITKTFDELGIKL